MTGDLEWLHSFCARVMILCDSVDEMQWGLTDLPSMKRQAAQVKKEAFGITKVYPRPKATAEDVSDLL